MESQTKIQQSISTKEFKKLWNINKDKIDVCKICEFRYMCNDPRIPHNRNDGSFYYDTECAYNPFIAKWERENNYYSLEECGIICNNATFTINMEILDSIQKMIDNQ